MQIYACLSIQHNTSIGDSLFVFRYHIKANFVRNIYFLPIQISSNRFIVNLCVNYLGYKHMDQLGRELGRDANYSRCTVCVGHSEGQCYCANLNETHLSNFISIYNEQIQMLVNTQPQRPLNQMVVEVQDQPINQLPPDMPRNRRQTKDNICHKRFTPIMRKLVKKYTGSNIPQTYKNQYYKECYFLIVLNYLEFKTPKLKEYFQEFQQQIKLNFIPQIEAKYHDQPGYLERLKKLAKDHLKAFQMFIDGKYADSLKIIYDFDNMKQKHHYYRELKNMETMRKSLGLSFES